MEPGREFVRYRETIRLLIGCVVEEIFACKLNGNNFMGSLSGMHCQGQKTTCHRNETTPLLTVPDFARSRRRDGAWRQDPDLKVY